MRNPLSFLTTCGAAFGLLLTLALSPTKAEAQNAVSFTYDASGNMTVRAKVVVRSKAPAHAGLQTMPDDGLLGGQRVSVGPRNGGTELLVEVCGLSADDDCILSVCNLSGQQYASMKACDSQTVIDLSSYRTGVYVLTVQLNGGRKSWKIIKN